MVKHRPSILIPAFSLALLLHLILLIVPAPQVERTQQPVRVLLQQWLPPRARYLQTRPVLPPDVRAERIESPQFRPPVAGLVDMGGPVARFAGAAVDSTDMRGVHATPARADTCSTWPMDPPVATEVDLNELALRASTEAARRREAYAHLHLPDADASRDAEKARSVVLRAVQAMGGMDALLAVREMHVMVAVEADENVIVAKSGTQIVDSKVLRVDPYLVPIAEWHMGPHETWVRARVSAPEDWPAYARDPMLSLGGYHRLFSSRWRLSADRASATRRRKREVARWHFLDQYLGDGVELSYVGRDPRHDSLEAIRVHDCRFGYSFEARFSMRTHLLDSVVESLPQDELRTGLARVPVWLTEYSDYRRVSGVMTPHRIIRQLVTGLGRSRSPLRAAVRLHVTYNAQGPQLAELSPDNMMRREE